MLFKCLFFNLFSKIYKTFADDCFLIYVLLIIICIANYDIVIKHRLLKDSIH